MTSNNLYDQVLEVDSFQTIELLGLPLWRPMLDVKSLHLLGHLKAFFYNSL